MQKTMTVSYQYRYSRSRSGIGRDLPTASKLVIANHILKKVSGFKIGDKIKVVYSQGSVTITKLT